MTLSLNGRILAFMKSSFDLSRGIPIHEAANLSDIVTAVTETLAGVSTRTRPGFGLGTPALWRCQGEWNRDVWLPMTARQPSEWARSRIDPTWDASIGDGFDVLGIAPTHTYASRDFVRFHASGYVYDVDRASHRNGSVSDPFKPRDHGGCFGTAATNDPSYNKLYATWHAMMSRCENPMNADYPTYGGRGIRVSPRWFVFSRFQKDAHTLPGAYYRRRDNTGIALDKDHFLSTMYSPETCVWMPEGINTIYARTRPFMATAPDGTTYYHVSASAFAKTHGLTQSKVSSGLGNGKPTKGWVFNYIDTPLRALAPKDPIAEVIRGERTQLTVGPWLPDTMPEPATADVFVNVVNGQLNMAITSTEPYAAAAYGLLAHILAAAVGARAGTLTCPSLPQHTVPVVIPEFSHLNDLDTASIKVG